ncbi:MAG TPA: diguanylate cyclase [Myxococcales bacterium]|nr:diguanylate cyclase [Myxococcales bacterium]HIL80339.1 diguanylate cyclase [Myxococcales bacterium]
MPVSRRPRFPCVMRAGCGRGQVLRCGAGCLPEQGHHGESEHRCLEVFAKVLKERSRSNDLACRPGGEEFLLILRGLDTQRG